MTLHENGVSDTRMWLSGGHLKDEPAGPDVPMDVWRADLFSSVVDALSNVLCLLKCKTFFDIHFEAERVYFKIIL